MKSFIFTFQIYNDTTKLDDMEVHQYEFIMLGTNPCIINDQMELKLGSVLSRWKEDIQGGEKTAAQYTIKFPIPNDPDNSILVVTKVPRVK